MKKLLVSFFSLVMLLTMLVTPVAKAAYESRATEKIAVSRSIASVGDVIEGVGMGFGIVVGGALYALTSLVLLGAATIVTGPFFIYYGLKEDMKCSPEVIENNIAQTDNILLELSKSEEFKGQEQFKQVVHEIMSIESSEEKVNRYFALLDIKTAEDMMHFVGARDSELEQYMNALVQNTGLTPELATLAVENIITSLQGPLK